MMDTTTKVRPNPAIKVPPRRQPPAEPVPTPDLWAEHGFALGARQTGIILAALLALGVVLSLLG